jgi:outer membrane protein assembly factor BamA
LVRTSVKNLENVYKDFGYSSVKVTPIVKTKPNGNIEVTFEVNEGPQDVVQSLDIKGNDTLPERQFAPHGLKLAPGAGYSAKLVDMDRNQILAKYLELGYLNATFHATVEPIEQQPHRLAVTYEINEGPRVQTATLVTLGRKDTKQKLINRETAQIRTGTPLKEQDLMQSESQLYTTGVFDWAQVDPRRQITTQTKEDVLTKVHEAKKNVLTYGFGFEVINRGGSVPSGTVALPGLPPVGLPKSFKTSEKTFYGPRGTFEYTRNNLRGKAESLTFSAFAGRLDQRASIVYTDPMFRWSEWSSNVSLSGENNLQNPIFSSRLAQFGYQLQKPLNMERTQNLFLRYSLSETGLTHLLIPQLVPPGDQHVRLSTVSATYTRDTRDNPLDAHKGIYESYEADVNPAALGSNFSFARLLTQTAYYHKIPDDIVWANSLRIGVEQGFDGSHVPLSEEFFSGGGSTLRGFPLNGAGPQRTIPACGNPADRSTCSFIRVPFGGDQLFIVNSEFRIPLPFKKQNASSSNSIWSMLVPTSLVPFYDGGNVYRSVGLHNFGAGYTNTVGGGLRWATPVGPLRFDVGHNLNSVAGIKSTQYFVTLGQAF